MTAKSELSRLFTVDPWPEGGIAVEIRADAGECRALARRFGLLGLERLAADGRLERAADGREFHFNGRLEAEVVQTCVVSLEPLRSTVEEPIERRYRALAPGERVPEALGEELVLDPEAVDVEPLEAPRIDLGAVVAEELGLALDPYPRAADAEEHLPELGPDISFGDEAREPGPFAVLEKLTYKRG